MTITIPVFPMGSRGIVTAIVLTVLAACPVLLADEARRLESVEEYIVSKSGAGVYQGAERVAEASLGAVIQATHKRGPWLYSDDLKGWIHSRHLVLAERAVDVFSQQIDAAATPQAYHLRGIAHMANGQWGRAVNDLEDAFELGESSVTLHMNLATCYRHLGFVQKALDEYETILKSFPDEPGAYLARGELALDEGRPLDALKDLTKALELSPDNAEIHNLTGLCFKLQGETEQAIAAYTQAVALDPRYIQAYLNRGFVHKWNGDLQSALSDYEQAVSLAPGSAAALNDLAWLLATCEDESVRDSARAVELALQACRLSSYSEPNYVDTLAAAFASHGQFDKAVETARTAVSLFDSEETEAIADVQSRLASYERQESFIERIDSQGR